MSRIVTSLCGLPSFGTLGGGTSTPATGQAVLGGATGYSPATSVVDVDALGGRATTTPGTTIPTTDRSSFYTSMADVVWFDGLSAVYALSKHAVHGDFAMSFWYNPYDQEFSELLSGNTPQGSVFGSMYGVLTGTYGSGSPFTGAGYFDIPYTSHPPSGIGITEQGKSVHAGAGGVYQNVGLLGYYYDDTDCPGFTTDPDDDMQGWCHIMIGFRAVSGVPKLTIYVNDTAICSGLTGAHNTGYPWIDGAANPVTDETFPAPFSIADFTDSNGFKQYWTIGGNQAVPSSSSDEGSLPASGNGLTGALTEVWIAPGQYIDWSNSANRQKFHTSDLVGQHFAPVSLGSGGQTPTGTKPQIYCTGTPSQFAINRANGKRLRVARYSTGGFVGLLLDYLKPPL